MESLSIADAMTSAMMVTVLAGMPILLIAMTVGLIVPHQPGELFE